MGSSGRPLGGCGSTCWTPRSSNQSRQRRSGGRSACNSRGWWRTSTTGRCCAWTAGGGTALRTPSLPPGFSSSPSKSLATGRAATASSTAGGQQINLVRAAPGVVLSVTPHPKTPQSSGGGWVETIEVYLQSQCLHCMQQTPLQVNQQSAHAEKKDPTRHRRRKEGRKPNRTNEGEEGEEEEEVRGEN